MTHEIITSIEEDSFNNGEYSNYDGWIITTNLQTIKVGISNRRCCCESWGYLSTLDNANEFVGAKLVDIKLTDTKLRELEDFDWQEKSEECSIMFVTFVTSVGEFQLIAYNSHNGYYGHEAVVISSQLNHTETL